LYERIDDIAGTEQMLAVWVSDREARAELIDGIAAGAPVRQLLLPKSRRADSLDARSAAGSDQNHR
jgi:hypothetical protein